ncbi:hypothetical protein [Microbacterium sp. BH-3-3-3]|uniref:hypothetical protein n=1 Tax=Microbacterium sp. BH-3-3-3 TaxID=1906742 RepID=UPI0011A10310|nr:hypothetical protein [Microbacterium sp. BH-3-3-3]
MDESSDLGTQPEANAARLFRIGPGYVSRWMHNATYHNALDDRERRAIVSLGQSLDQLIRRRDALEAARRACIPVSRLDTRNSLTGSQQRAIFAATKDFFLNYYAAVSAMASVVARFGSIFPGAPTRSNEKFLEWLTNIALLEEHWDVLRSARQFRTLIDHPASKQPYEWGTVDDEGYVRAMLHGPASLMGNLPEGATLIGPGKEAFHIDDVWAFIAPDEDMVLTLVAVQLNALIDRIQVHRFRPESLPCGWEVPHGDEDPEEGYPVFAIGPGTVMGSGPMTPEVSDEDRAKIAAILAPYEAAIREGDSRR